MKNLVLGLMLLSTVNSYANDVVLKVGKSVVIEANTPTKILCESEISKAPYLCRLQIETSFDTEKGEYVPSGIKIMMKNKNVDHENIVYVRHSFYKIENDSSDQDRASFQLENDRILKKTEFDLSNLITRGICEKH